MKLQEYADEYQNDPEFIKESAIIEVEVAIGKAKGKVPFLHLVQVIISQLWFNSTNKSG